MIYGTDALNSCENLVNINISEGNKVFEFDVTNGMLFKKNESIQEKSIIFITENSLKRKYSKYTRRSNYIRIFNSTV